MDSLTLIALPAMSSPARKFFPALSLAVALLVGLLTPTPAPALPTYFERPSTIWGHIYAGPATKNKQTPRPKVAYLDATNNLIGLKGAVPGPRKSLIIVNGGNA